MNELQDGDIEVDGFLMGRGQPVFAKVLAPGEAEVRVQDSLAPLGNLRHFGEDC